MSEIIKHEGIIDSIEDRFISVLIESNSACGSCSAKKMCGMSEMKSKKIIVSIKGGYEDGSDINTSLMQTGDKVEVGIASNMGLKASVLSYFFPFLVLLIVLILVKKIFNNDLLAALTAVASMLLYYVIIKNILKSHKMVSFFLIKER